MFTDYLDHLYAEGINPSTAKLYTGHLTRLQEQHPDLWAVTNNDLVRYLAARRTTHKAESRKSMRTAWRSYYRWAHAAGHITTDPAAALKPIRIPKTATRVAPDNDVQRALTTADLHTRAMILLARYACLRLSEITKLHSRDRTGDLLHILGKGEKERYVPANPELLAVLVELERVQGPGHYFPGRGEHPHLHKTTVERHIKTATGWNPHSLRHAGATAAYAATGDLRAVQEFLGHASLATTERYLHTDINAIRRVAAGTVFLDDYRSPHLPAVA